MNESNYKIEQVAPSYIYCGASGFKLHKVGENIQKEKNKFEAKLFRKL